MTNPYQRFKPEDLVFRDELALDRTVLANERTLLAYLRSGVALILAGVTFIHFAQDPWFKVVGVLCLPAGIIVMLVGAVRYRAMNARINVARKQFASATPHLPKKHAESGNSADGETEAKKQDVNQTLTRNRNTQYQYRENQIVT